MSEYEMVTLLHPRLDEEGVATTTEWVQTRIKDLGGEVSEVKPWGRRRLAYQIQKLNEATYVQFDFTLDGRQLTELNRFMRLNEDIIRQLPIRK
ncbi:MAG: 30S ribosomal protein S6 [Caldilineales bacterium]|nr:30S ribosomal protein S6 [Caldilineales bacterium]